MFIDHHDHLTNFIQFVIGEFQKQAELNDGGVGARSIESLTQINLYHRLLECYLYKQQSIETEIKNKAREKEGRIMPTTTSMPRFTLEAQTEQASTADRIKKVKDDINALIEKYDNKIDKHYVLFLFQIYEYTEGVKNCCEKLNLRQELLNFYVAQNLPDRVLEVCKNQNTQIMFMQADMLKDDTAGVDGDLWIQALTFFRDLKRVEDCEKYLEEALEYIGENNILSPLLVLEILSDTKEKDTRSNNKGNRQEGSGLNVPKKSSSKTNQLRFKVLKKFLISKLKTQVDSIEKNSDKVEEHLKSINSMKSEISRMKSTARTFDKKVCDHCEKELQLPTVHFLCSHSYHEHCVDSEGIRHCSICVHGKFNQRKLNLLQSSRLSSRRNSSTQSSSTTRSSSSRSCRAQRPSSTR